MGEVLETANGTKRAFLLDEDRGPDYDKCGLQPGHALDLGIVLLRQDGAFSVRVIGI